MLHIIQSDPDVPPGNIVEHLTIPCMIHHTYRDGLLPEPEQIGGRGRGRRSQPKRAGLFLDGYIQKHITAAGKS